jgi:hypothetical protein
MTGRVRVKFEVEVEEQSGEVKMDSRTVKRERESWGEGK